MAWDPVWDEVFRDRRWGKYPPEELVRFLARNFYDATDRGAVRILEIGCGPGANLWCAAREGLSVFGVDGSETALEAARERFASEGLRGEFRRADAVSLPYPDGFFDGALDVECLYSNDLEDSRRIVREVHRVLKPGGAFFSKTFMAGTTSLPGDRGIIRLLAEKDIPALYGVFRSVECDTLARTEDNRSREIKEWLITCRK